MDFTLPTGAKLVVTEASYEDAIALLELLVGCMDGISLPNDIFQANVSVLKDLLVRAIKSQDVKAALFKCAQRATYENVRVEPALFDDPKLREKARADYFLILWRIVEVNCGPFFGKTFSELRERLKTSPYFQPSPSEPVTPS